ncbi:M48 family metallopeptidase [Qiania dongpingensis]|uniref:M48 family metallopeptidase n=1 Tax=Qiania dongpingensis TaxID=2763669 RepID=A0A7G9G0T4_9FIRM|nr:SprT family zinc-dependent metalloprotease [Qiania dongpingensis]QNM04416.1 M48 family metallopeptidase [Qiania dongpingensis]
MEAPFPYKVIYSKRNTVSLQVTADGNVILRAPEGCPESFLESFLQKKSGWVLNKLEERERYRRSDDEQVRRFSDDEKQAIREKAELYFRKRTEEYAEIMQVTYGRITIREQKTRWGSCSLAGNLNFNWRLMLAPEFIREYVIVHELAHRKEMNHSSRFYHEVSRIFPDYKIAVGWLKKHGPELWIR